MIGDFDIVLDALTVNPQRSLEELEDDWTTSMELAETLQKEHHIPFRVGHGFASSIVTFARANGGVQAEDLPLSEGRGIVREDAIHAVKLPGRDAADGRETEFRQVLSPAFMVKTRVGIGGPQPAEVERMLAEARKTLVADKTWMKDTRGRLASSNEKLDKAFNRLLGKAD